MKYNELNLEKQTKKKRVGRGISAGQGKTAGRGTKGQKSRTGASKNPGFSGGQNPLMQQLPKLPGFRSHKAKPAIILTSQLNALKIKEITAQTLTEAGLTGNAYQKIKLLYDEEVTAAVEVKLPAASQQAVDSVEKAGGSFVKTTILQRPKKSKE